MPPKTPPALNNTPNAPNAAGPNAAVSQTPPTAAAMPTNAKKTPMSPRNANMKPDDPSDTLLDQTVVIWPEWSEAEVATEKWSSKHAFEDPEGLVVLPKSLRHLAEGVKRASELVGEGQTPVIVQPLSTVDELFLSNAPLAASPFALSSASQVEGSGGTHPSNHTNSNMAHLKFLDARNDSTSSLGPSNGSMSRTGSVPLPTPAVVTISDSSANIQPSNSQEFKKDPASTATDQNPDALLGTSKLFQSNRHILDSEFMRSLLSIVHYVYECHRASKTQTPQLVEEPSPWDCIYPKAKDGIPIYNPSGKYIVKLFWLGAWRKIVIDDRVPVDASGKPLLVSSPFPLEIWPLLVCKALLKVASFSYKEHEGACDTGDFDILCTLRGWIPEKLPIRNKSISNLGSTLHTLLQTKAVIPQPVALAPTHPAPGPGNAKDAAGKAAAAIDRASVATVTRSTPPTGTHLLTTSAVNVFALKKSEESDTLDVKSKSYLFRICEIREVQDVLSEPNNTPNFTVRVRCYYSSGIKRVTSNPKDKVEDGLEYSDFWISYAEFCQMFSSVYVYHYPASFKMVKTLVQINDPAKPNETYKVPQILSIPEDTRDGSVLVSMATFGRILQNSQTASPSFSLEEFQWSNPVYRPPTLRIATNFCGSSLLKLSPG